MINYFEIEKIGFDFQKISLTELSAFQLMERKDTKFIFSVDMVPDLLRDICPYYKILSVNQQVLQPYTTIYYDTYDLLMYHHHQNGKQNRCKVRVRRYDALNRSYAEVKWKTNKDETIKKRMEIPNPYEFTTQAKQFIESETRIKFSEFHETLTNQFTRITLVNHTSPERITMDLNLSFQQGAQRTDYPAMVVAEVKQVSKSPSSCFFGIMKKAGIRPNNFS